MRAESYIISTLHEPGTLMLSQSEGCEAMCNKGNLISLAGLVGILVGKNRRVIIILITPSVFLGKKKSQWK